MFALASSVRVVEVKSRGPKFGFCAMEKKIGKSGLVSKKIPKGVPKRKSPIFLNSAKIQKQRFLRNIQKTLVFRVFTYMWARQDKTVKCKIKSSFRKMKPL